MTWSSWWLNQPIWKICSSNWIISPKFGMKIKNTLPETNIAPENWPLEKEIPDLETTIFGSYVRSREGISNHPVVFSSFWSSQNQLETSRSPSSVFSLPGTLKLTAGLHLKMDGWNTILSFWDVLFSGAFAVSFRECSKKVIQVENWTNGRNEFRTWIVFNHFLQLDILRICWFSFQNGYLKNSIQSSWWFQPIWNARQNGNLPQSSGWK